MFSPDETLLATDGVTARPAPQGAAGPVSFAMMALGEPAELHGGRRCSAFPSRQMPGAPYIAGTSTRAAATRRW